MLSKCSRIDVPGGKKVYGKESKKQTEGVKDTLDNQVSTTLNRKKALLFFFLHPMLFRSHETD